MKTQISNLRSGTKVQLLNPAVDYTQLNAATSHNGHAGSTSDEVIKVWHKLIEENPEGMKVRICGLELDLKANWSVSGKSVTYWGAISAEDVREVFKLTPAKDAAPSVSIQDANVIIVSNGKNAKTYVCPSLITIL